jgi:integrase
MKPASHVIYYKKSPSTKQKRASFAVVKKETDRTTGATSQKTIDAPAVTALNKQLKDNVLTYAEVTAHIDDLIRKLNESERKKRDGIWVANSENQKLLDQYWNEKYGAKPKIRRPQAARTRLQWAIKLIRETSILEKRTLLQDVVDKCCEGNSRKQRRLCSVLNELRKWHRLPMSERLSREQKPTANFKYLTESQFLKALEFVQESEKVSALTYKALFTCLFYSGARTGEAFAFKPHHLLNQKIKIHTQIDRDGIECQTKTDKKRTAILFEEANEEFRIWCAAKDKEDISRTNISRVWLKACKKAFPNDSSLWTTAHDLRHSYAVKCLTVHQISLDYVAKLLGDSIQVCEEYYLSFEQNDALLDHVIQSITRQKPT